MMREELKQHGFTVEDNKLNKIIIPNCCEYSNSKVDGLVYHTHLVFRKDMSAFAFAIHGDDSKAVRLKDSEATSGIDSDAEVDVESVAEEKVETSACGFEIKSDFVSEAAINECIYNMFGSATKISYVGNGVVSCY